MISIYYIEYHDAGRQHPAGHRIAVDSSVVLLGRDETANIRFYDDTPTVSRRHAMLRITPAGVQLEPLSQTNSTLLNGRRIFAPEILANGDEIRLSTNGPRLGIIIPGSRQRTLGPTPAPGRTVRDISPTGLPLPASPGTTPGNGGGDKSLKYLLVGLIALVVLAIGLLIFKTLDLPSGKDNGGDTPGPKTDSIAQVIAAQDGQAPADGPAYSGITDGVTPQQGGSGADQSQQSGGITVNPSGTPSEAAMKVADRSVYFVVSLGFEVTTPAGDHYEIECGQGENEVPGWSGTGFLLSDGRFVTARHVVEPWYFIQDETDGDMVSLNIIASNGGKVVSYIGAVSPTGDRLVFKSTDCVISRRNDKRSRLSDGETVTVAPMGSRDFATFATDRRGGLPFSGPLSRDLRRGTKLTVLSFPLGLGAYSDNNINPVYGTATVAADGLQEGMILTTETTYERGSSGGPVFVTDSSGRLVVVGITSAIAGRSTGFIEPISSIR